MTISPNFWLMKVLVPIFHLLTEFVMWVQILWNLFPRWKPMNTLWNLPLTPILLNWEKIWISWKEKCRVCWKLQPKNWVCWRVEIILPWSTFKFVEGFFSPFKSSSILTCLRQLRSLKCSASCQPSPAWVFLGLITPEHLEAPG